MDLQENVPLHSLCTLGVGGSARYYTVATERSHVGQAVSWAEERSLPLLVLGGGSNLVISDAGFLGLVLKMDLRGVLSEPMGDNVIVHAAAGEPWDAFVDLAVQNEWAGIECLSGIPGLVGATPMQNVGAYGQEVRETVEGVDVYDRRERRETSFTNAECGFGYRDSRFKSADQGRYVVLGVHYRLRPKGAPNIRYADLQHRLEERGMTTPTLKEVRELVLEVRRSKSMLLDPADGNTRSVGSFFMNPILNEESWRQVQATWARDGDGTPFPHYPSSAGVKLSAAWLIERAGFQKGLRKGKAGLSTRHTLAIVNADNARAEEIVALAREIRDGVERRFGVRLRPEPVFIGLSLD